MQQDNVTLKKKEISLRVHFIFTLNYIRVTLFFGSLCDPNYYLHTATNQLKLLIYLYFLVIKIHSLIKFYYFEFINRKLYSDINITILQYYNITMLV
jgi:hypothetical protein